MMESKKGERVKSLLPLIIHGGAWILFLRISQVAMQALKLVFLARILAPADFGIIGIALLTTMILETFSQTGFEAALIQKKEDIKTYLNSVWTVLIIRSAVLFIILYLIAPYVEIFFNCSGATQVIRVIGLSIILQACVNIAVVYFHKEIQFQKEFYYRFSGTAVNFIVTISLLFWLRNIWAFVFGYLAGHFTSFVASYLVHSFRPSFELQLKKIKELFGFGKWVMGSSVLIFLGIHGDDIFVGKFMGAAMLGLYQMAYNISNMPATEITHLISKISFPAYSKMQDNPPRLRESFLRILDLTTFFSFPMGVLIYVFAADFTIIFLGEKWFAMVPAMQILAIYGIMRSINAVFGAVFQAVGKPSIITKVSLYYVIFLAITIYPFIQLWGLVGVAWAVTLSNVLGLVFCLKAIYKILHLNLANITKVIYMHALMSIAILLLSFTFKFIFNFKITSAADFILSILSAVILYMICSKKTLFLLLKEFKQKR